MKERISNNIGENNQETSRDKSPFLNLTKSSLSKKDTTFYDIPNNPDVLVRQPSAPLQKKIFSLDTDYATKTKEFSSAVAAFNDIVKRYGWNIAETNYVIGNDPQDGKSTLFGVTERISGQNLDKAPGVDDGLFEKIEEFYLSFVQHVVDSYKEDGLIWADFRNEQIIYGTRPGEEEKKLYIVDVDPEVYTWTTNLSGKRLQNMSPEQIKVAQYYGYLKVVCDNMAILEFRAKRPFKKVHEALKIAIHEGPKTNSLIAMELAGDLPFF